MDQDKPTGYTLEELSKFISVSNGRPQKKPKLKKTVWKVVYIGKELFEGSYSQCISFKNQFKGQRDYQKYVIK